MSSSNDALAQPVVINTRPIERAAPLTQHLQNAGFRVVDMPMLALQTLPTTADDSAIMRQWLAGAYQALIIVSPTAAAQGLALWQSLEPQAFEISAPSHIIAVGTATAAVLEEADIAIQVLQPTIANNEGMLAMPEIEHLQAGDKLLVWRGLGGRRLLVNTLQARGVHIDSIAWYERTLPVEAQANYAQWVETSKAADAIAKGIKPIVIISSGTAFEHWEKVLTHADQALSLADFEYVVLGKRLAQMAFAEHLDYRQVEDLEPQTILEAIDSNRAVHNQ